MYQYISNIFMHLTSGEEQRREIIFAWNITYCTCHWRPLGSWNRETLQFSDALSTFKSLVCDGQANFHLENGEKTIKAILQTLWKTSTNKHVRRDTREDKKWWRNKSKKEKRHHTRQRENNNRIEKRFRIGLSLTPIGMLQTQWNSSTHSVWHFQIWISAWQRTAISSSWTSRSFPSIISNEGAVRCWWSPHTIICRLLEFNCVIAHVFGCEWSVLKQGVPLP